VRSEREQPLAQEHRTYQHGDSAFFTLLKTNDAGKEPYFSHKNLFNRSR
jgi:hypothetical protein